MTSFPLRPTMCYRGCSCAVLKYREVNTDLDFKAWTRFRDIARAARRDRDARNMRFRVEHTQHKGQICILDKINCPKNTSMQPKCICRKDTRRWLAVQSPGILVKLTQVGGGEPNLINRGRNEKKAIDSASSLRCLGSGRQKWSLRGKTLKMEVAGRHSSSLFLQTLLEN